MIWIIVLLNRTAPQNLMIFLRVNFFTKSFLNCLLHDNRNLPQPGFPIKTANVELDDIPNEVDDTYLEDD